MLFQRHFLRFKQNIPYCFTLERQSRLFSVVPNRPWAAALERLLRERHMKKGELAELADMRAGNISRILNSPRPPEVPTLQRIAAALGVELWEFFVSDEQAMVLRAQTKQRQVIIDEQDTLKRFEQEAIAKYAESLRSLRESMVTGKEPEPDTNHPNKPSLAYRAPQKKKKRPA